LIIWQVDEGHFRIMYVFLIVVLAYYIHPNWNCCIIVTCELFIYKIVVMKNFLHEYLLWLCWIWILMCVWFVINMM
jgi:hypothetical protein